MPVSIRAFFILVFAFSSSLALAEIDKRHFPTTLTFDNQSLQLGGVGTRTKFFVDVYDAGLYLKSAGQSAEQIIQTDQPTAIRLVITSKLITGKKMAKATRDGFKQAAGDELASIEGEMNRLVDAFKDKIRLGDYFDLVYIPGKGTSVIKNGETKTRVEGLKFKQILFSIWLGDKPVQKSMRKALLAAN